MVLHPGVQLKAREEIDRVIGELRLPTAEDRGKLPYVEAVVKEVFRFHPVAPMGLPHLATEEDLYEGYLIPKDAIIVPNIWLVPKLRAFNPSRPFSCASSLEPKITPHDSGKASKQY